jgi:hypothetical protein
MDCVQQTVFAAEHAQEFTGCFVANSVEQPEDLSALDSAAETGDRTGVLDEDHVAEPPHRGHVIPEGTQPSAIQQVTAHFGRKPR